MISKDKALRIIDTHDGDHAVLTRILAAMDEVPGGLSELYDIAEIPLDHPPEWWLAFANSEMKLGDKPVTRITRDTTTSEYTLHGGRGQYTVNPTQFADYRTMRIAVAEAAGKPPAALPKGQWPNVWMSLFQAATDVEVGEEETPEGMAREYIARYVRDTLWEKHAQPVEAGQQAYLLNDGRLALVIGHFADFQEKHHYRWTRAELRRRFEAYGCHRGLLNVTITWGDAAGTRSTARVWFVPADKVEEVRGYY